MNLSKIYDAQFRKRGMLLWTLLVLLWATFRAILVQQYFSKYGVNSKLYLAIDLLSSVPYAISSGKLIIAIIDKKTQDSLKWLIATTIFFYIPDVYIFLSAHKVPNLAYGGLIIWIAIFTWISVVQLRRKSSSS